MRNPRHCYLPSHQQMRTAGKTYTRRCCNVFYSEDGVGENTRHTRSRRQPCNLGRSDVFCPLCIVGAGVRSATASCTYLGGWVRVKNVVPDDVLSED